MNSIDMMGSLDTSIVQDSIHKNRDTKDKPVLNYTSNGFLKPHQQIRGIVKLVLSLEQVECAVARMTSSVIVSITREDGKVTSPNLCTKVVDENDNLIESKISYFARGKYRIEFTPKVQGICSFQVKSALYEFINDTFTVMVNENCPVASFSHGSDWPLALTMGNDHDLYVLYLHHVSKFHENGKYLGEFIRDNDVCFHDIQSSKGWRVHCYVIVSVTEYTDVVLSDTNQRKQQIRIYNRTGQLLRLISGEKFCLPIMRRREELPLMPVFRLSMDHVKNQFLVASKNLIYRCHQSSEAAFHCPAESGLELNGIETITNFVLCKNGSIVAMDSYDGTVTVFDKYAAYYSCIDRPDKGQVQLPCSLTGLAVDSSLNILISDYERNEIRVYNMDGEFLGVIRSHKDSLRGPMGLTVSNDGFVFVADHLNGCIKKYKYI